MNNEIQVFTNEQLGQVRTVMIDGEPWFVAADVCKSLALSNPTVAAARLDEDERAKFNLGRQGESTIVSESGLYTLVLSSRKPEAKAFKRWITHEVIPSIRKHGAYMTKPVLEQMLEQPETIVLLAQRLLAEQAEKEDVKNQLKAAQPKADYFDAFVSEKDLTNLRNTAKELGIPQNIFISILLEKGCLYRDQNRRLLPKAEYAEQGRGYFALRDVYCRNGSLRQQTLVTAKGKAWFRVKFKKWMEV